jgi:hypothetical protein
VWELCFVVRCVGLLAVVSFIVAGCSDDTPMRKDFNTKGLIAPAGLCAANPERFGEAQKINDIDLGNGCFVHNAYEVRSLVGVSFNQKAKMNCGVANEAARWLEAAVQPAADNAFGEKVVGIHVPSAFACRPRNNQRGAKLSEHGMGNALDVSVFVLESGRKVSVLHDWNGDSDSRRFLRQVRASACGPFKTVLGPGSDPHHDDHLHMDLQRHRSGGTYCK